MNNKLVHEPTIYNKYRKIIDNIEHIFNSKHFILNRNILISKYLFIESIFTYFYFVNETFLFLKKLPPKLLLKLSLLFY